MSEKLECATNRQLKKRKDGLYYTNEALTVCRYCGSHSPKVECAGLYHCNNLLCMGPGATWFRAGCQTYKEKSRVRHTVDRPDWETMANEYLKTPEGNGYVAFWDKPYKKSTASEFENATLKNERDEALGVLRNWRDWFCAGEFSSEAAMESVTDIVRRTHKLLEPQQGKCEHNIPYEHPTEYCPKCLHEAMRP